MNSRFEVGQIWDFYLYSYGKFRQPFQLRKDAILNGHDVHEVMDVCKSTATILCIKSSTLLGRRSYLPTDAPTLTRWDFLPTLLKR